MKKLVSILIAFALLLATCALAGAPDVVRPSRKWLGECSADVINGLITLSTDADYLNAIGIPEILLNELSPAPAYEAEPAAVIYAPSDEAALGALTSLAGTDDLPEGLVQNAGSFFPTMLLGTLYQHCTTEQLALAGAIYITDYRHCQTEMPYAAAFFMPADNAEGSAILLQSIPGDGILTLKTCWMPADIVKRLIDKESTISTSVTAMNAEILRPGDISPDFEPDMSVPETIPAADEAWITATALETAGRMASKAADPEYMRLYTADDEILAICTELGALDIENAVVSSIEYIDQAQLSQIMEALTFDPESDAALVLERFQTYAMPGLVMRSQLNAFGAKMVAAGSVCTVGSILPARSEFIGCMVMLDCGGGFDVSVSIGFTENNIAVINCIPIPAE